PLPSAPSAVIAPKRQEPPPSPPPQKPQAPAQKPADLAPAPDSDKAAVPPPPAAPKAEVKGTPTEAVKTADEKALPESETIRVKAREVNVVFTVTDRKGRYIKDLTKEQIKVLDNRQSIPELRSFMAESNLPLRVGLLIDASSSIRERFKFEQEAA